MAVNDPSTRLEAASAAGDAALFSAALVFAAPLTVFLGPVAAWLLHRRRLDRKAVISGLLGLLAALLVCGLVVGAIALFARLSGRFDPTDLSGGIALLLAAGVALCADALALDIDAVRDLLPGRRVHVGLDVTRLVVTLVLVLGAVAITLVMRGNAASEIGDAGPFALLFAAIGALTVFFGNTFARHLRSLGGPVA